MKSIRSFFTTMLLVITLIIGMMPAVTLPADAADDHEFWMPARNVGDMLSHEENGMYVIEPGEYYLVDNPYISKPLLIRGEVTICLHGHSLKAEASKNLQFTICIEEDGVLNIEICGAGGDIVNLNPNCFAAIWNDGGELNISGGNIGSNQDAIHSENGIMHISGGVLSAGARGIYMSGGRLDVDSFAEINGPDTGIYAYGGQVNINRGIISSAKANSSGISLNGYTSCYINDGDIKGVQYGVYAVDKSKLVFTGGDVTSVGPSPVSIYSRNSDIMISENSMLMPRAIGQIDIEGGSVDITGGCYSDSPGAYISEDYKIIDSGYSSCPHHVVEKDKYTVTFTDGSGKTLGTQTVYEGRSAVAPSNPARQGFAFAGWDKDFASVTADLTVNALWKAASPVADLPSVKIAKPKAAKKAVTVKWKKVSKKNQKKIDKIEIQVATDKNFTNGVKTAYGKKSKTSVKVKGLKSKKTYYVRIRAYKNAGGVIHVSKWSGVKKVKVK